MLPDDEPPLRDAQVSVDTLPNGSLQVRLAGNWRFDAALPNPPRLPDEEDPTGRPLSFEAGALGTWDSSLLLWVERILAQAKAQARPVHTDGLPDGLRRLLDLAGAVPPPSTTPPVRDDGNVLARLGRYAHRRYSDLHALLAFIGELAIGFARLLRGRARFRRRDLGLFVQQAGIEALPIVGMLSFLIGMVLAFVGAVQLAMFGAQIYVADLVGIGMTREMGAMMAAIIMAGRTGASYAAQLGTMQVNEELDAYRTLGVPPMEFLVLPRVLALTLMLPLLCVYADLLGILGGMAASVLLHDIGGLEYLQQTRDAVTFTHLGIGLFKSLVFGLLVSLAGCYQGMRCGRSSAAVGAATTRAVVAAIVSIMVADSIAAVITSLLGI